MFANRYTVLVDACSLAGVYQRNLLLSLAEADMFRLRWSEEILGETERAIEKIMKTRPDKSEAAKRATESMRTAFPEAMVEDYRNFMPAAKGVPDTNDEHVVAAALKTHASMLVTENLRDFPSSFMDGLNIEVKTSDEFIADAIELDSLKAISAISKMRHRFKRPEIQSSELLITLESRGLISTAGSLRRYESIL